MDPEVADAIWAASEPRPPVPTDAHPLGCHHPRVPDRVCSRGILIRLVTGSSWVDSEAIMTSEVSDTTPRAPLANAIAERVGRTLRTECLDHLIPLDEQHLRTILAEYVAYGNTERPPRSLGLESPLARARSPRSWWVLVPVWSDRMARRQEGNTLASRSTHQLRGLLLDSRSAPDRAGGGRARIRRRRRKHRAARRPLTSPRGVVGAGRERVVSGPRLNQCQGENYMPAYLAWPVDPIVALV
jgi:hypothetical protein